MEFKKNDRCLWIAEVSFGYIWLVLDDNQWVISAYYRQRDVTRAVTYNRHQFELQLDVSVPDVTTYAISDDVNLGQEYFEHFMQQLFDSTVYCCVNRVEFVTSHIELLVMPQVKPLVHIDQWFTLLAIDGAGLTARFKLDKQDNTVVFNYITAKVEQFKVNEFDKINLLLHAVDHEMTQADQPVVKPADKVRPTQQQEPLIGDLQQHLAPIVYDGALQLDESRLFQGMSQSILQEYSKQNGQDISNVYVKVPAETANVNEFEYIMRCDNDVIELLKISADEEENYICDFSKNKVFLNNQSHPETKTSFVHYFIDVLNKVMLGQAYLEGY